MSIKTFKVECDPEYIHKKYIYFLMYEGIRDTPGVLLISYTIYTQKARI